MCSFFTEMKQESRNRLSHMPCQQTVANTAVCSTMAVSITNDGSSVTAVEHISHHSSLVPAWPGGVPTGSAALTAVPQMESASSLQSTGIAATASQSSGFQCPPNAPVSGLSHTSDLQIPSQPFAGYHDGSTQLQDHCSPSTNTSSVR